MLLAPYPHAPKAIPLAAAAAGVAPTAIQKNPLTPGMPVEVAGAATANLVGASINRFTPLKHARIVVAAANVTPGANIVGQTAGARVGADVTGDLVLQFGSAAGQVLSTLTAHTVAADADTHLAVIVVMNGRVLARIVDNAAPDPAPGQFCADADTNIGFNLVIGASTGVDAIKAGTEIDVFLASNIGFVAKRGADGVLVASTALAAGVPEERYLGVPASTVDTAGRTVVQLVNSDFVMAETAALAIVGTNL